MKTNNYLVLMTACINPNNGSIEIVRNDPELRLQDYLNALNFWLSYQDQRLDKIVFIENSGSSLLELQQVAKRNNPFNREIEFIAINNNYYPKDVHYGYAELHMIDVAFSESKLLKECSYFIKVTGRLTFPATSRLLDRLPNDYIFAVDSRDNSLFVSSPQCFVTTQLMIFKSSFYQQNLINVKAELSPDLPLIEDLLFKKLLTYKNNKSAILRWPVNVDPVGYAAHWHKKYDSPKQKFINLVRNLARITFPHWWV